MVTIEEKLSLFSKLVFQDILNESEKKIKALEEKNAALIEEYRKELIEKSKKITLNMDRKIEQKKSEMLSKAKMEVKQSLLSKKQELLDRILEEQKNKAKEFIHTNEYALFFKKNFEAILSELPEISGLRIEIMERDREAFQEYIEKAVMDNGYSPEKISYIEGSKAMIGGIIVSNIEGTLRYDASISSLLEDKKAFIMERMYEELEKVGDLG